MRSLDRDFLAEQAVPLEMAGTLRRLGEYRGRQELFSKQTPHILQTLREAAIIQSTESSSRIEGVVVAHERLKPLLNKTVKPRSRPEAEVVGYRNVLSKIHTSFRHYAITPETILSLHKDMLKATGLPTSHWKRRDNTIEERLKDGRWVTRFEPVSARHTPHAIQELCRRFNQLRDQGAIDILLLIHSFVFDFLCIHPFMDGNGRVSRLLNVLLLHQAGYEVGRFISLEKMTEESKETYYEVLHKSSQRWHEGRHRLLPWWEYSLGILTDAYKEFETRVEAIRAPRGTKTEWIRETIWKLPDTFRISDIERACPGVSRPMIRVVLEALRKDGQLKTTGLGRNAAWQKLRHPTGTEVVRHFRDRRR